MSAVAPPVNFVSSCPVAEQPPGQSLDVEALRKEFPILKRYPNALFFDNAATSQKPRIVLDTMTRFYEEECANSGRAAYSLSTRLSRKIEDSREAVARFLNAKPCNVAFTNGATDSLNLVATAWGLNNLKDGDEIMLCPLDHHSAILPWFNLQAVLKRFDINVKIVQFSMHSSGTYDRKSLAESLSARTRIVALCHIHHLYGMEMDLPELRAIIPNDVLISLDASQSVGHTPVDTQKLGVQFISFSGHKMFAANGTGVLWVASEVKNQLWPARAGGKSAIYRSNEELAVDRTTLAGIIECGTLNLPGILSCGAAVDFIENLGIHAIEQQLSCLTEHLYRGMKQIPGIEFAPGIGVCGCTKGYGIIGFKLAGVSSTDLAAFFDSEKIYIRSGDHCISSIDDEDFARVSLHIYNTLDEIDHFLEVLSDAAC